MKRLQPGTTDASAQTIGPKHEQAIGKRARRWYGEVIVAGAVMLFAALVRLPYLQQIPRLTDEVTLWRLAVDSLEDGSWPLVFADTGYNGPALIYLLAAGHRLVPELETPRLVALLLGSVTVVIAYALGRTLHGRFAGLLAAALLAVSATPVYVYSHVLHFTTPALLLQVSSWWLAALAVKHEKGYLAALSAFSAGLAIQMHPLAAAFVPGLALWLWLRPEGRRLLSSRWALAMVAAILLALAPLIAYHAPAVLAGGDTKLSGAAEGLVEHWNEVPYPTGVVNLARSMLDALSGARHPDAAALRTDWLVWLTGLLSVAGSVLAARRGEPIPLILIASALIFMPLPMRSYDNTSLCRYSGLVLPALHLGIALGAAVLWREPPASRRRDRRPAFLMTSLALCVFAGLGYRLVDHYATEQRAGRTNEPLWHVASIVTASDRPVVLDGTIKRTDGRGTGPSGALHGVFRWQGTDFKKWSSPDELDRYLLAITWPVLLIASDSTIAQLSIAEELQPVDGGYSAPLSDTPGWGIYRYDPPLEPRQ